MSDGRIVVMGAGGFAREVRWLIEEIAHERGGFRFVGYAVSDLSKLGEHDSKEQVLGDIDWLVANRDRFDLLALGIGTPAARLKIAAALEPHFPDDRWPALVHPSVRMDHRSCKLGPGVLLCAGTVATVNVSFGDFSMVNLCCTLGHEANLGRGVVMNPTVNISGGVTLEDGVLVGTGAQVLQYVRVGRGATVGAGAVVTKDVAEGETVVGIPAKPLKK